LLDEVDLAKIEGMDKDSDTEQATEQLETKDQ
jgi:hypothetical protein